MDFKIFVFCMVALVNEIVAGKDKTFGNIGVFMEHLGQVHSTTNYWLHSFAIDLPTMEHPRNAFWDMSYRSCYNETDTGCDHRRELPMSNFLASLNYKIYNKVQRVRKIAMSSLPYLFPKSAKESNRKKRAVLGFIGGLSKTLFGTATMEDMNRVANTVNKLIGKQRESRKAIVSLQDTFVSLSKNMNIRFSNVKNVLASNHKAIQSLVSWEKHFSRDVESRLNVISQALVNLNTTDGVIDFLSDYSDAVMNLCTGNLPSMFVSSTEVNNAIDHINKVIRERTGLNTKGIIQDTYKKHHPSFFTSIRNNKIIITIKFPIGSLDMKSNLFKVRTFPVPTHPDRSHQHTSEIKGLPSYIIISMDDSKIYYSSLTSEMFAKCKRHQMWTCPFNLVYVNTLLLQRKDCVTAILTNAAENIYKACEFVYKRNGMSKSIIPISDKSADYLVYGMDRIFVDFPNSTSTWMKGCMFCTIHLPCGAMIDTEGMKTDRAITQRCITGKNTEIQKKLYINLAMAYALLPRHPKLTASVNTREGSIPNLPDFDIFEHQYKEFVIKDKSMEMDLKHMIENTKKGRQIFNDLAEPIAELSNFNIPNKYHTIWLAIISVIQFLIILKLSGCRVCRRKSLNPIP